MIRKPRNLLLPLVLLFLGACERGCVDQEISACSYGCDRTGKAMESYNTVDGCKCVDKEKVK